jgi:hypothetical protein
MDDVVAIRLQLARIVAEAESDPEFHQRLAADPAAVLAENGIPETAVEDFSQAIGRSRLPVAADDDPTGCIHTEGCRDFTCFSSHCPPTCFVSIVIDAPDS